MGKASSAKKVARAARAGGKVTGQRRNLGFPAAIVAIVVLGVGLVAFARQNTPGGGEPELGQHWHAAYGIYVCDRWVANLSDRGTDALGIHTHTDGLIHIHPFLAGAAGRSATLGKFFDQVGMKVTDSAITLPPGDQFKSRTYKNGETTCGDKKGRVVMAYWENAQTASGKADDIRTSNISGEHFEADLGAITIAFLPEGESVPPPPSAANILENAAADGPLDTPANEDATQEDLQGQFSEEGSGDTAPAGEEGTETTAPAEEGTETTAPAEEGSDTTAPADEGSETTAPADEGSSDTTAPAGG